jgi:DNA primase
MAQFSSHFLDEIRQRVRPSELIGRNVKLQSRARGEFTGLCPFHKEKTPSFTVSDAKGFYHCFGCGAHGDIITYLMQKQGLGFPEAVAELAQQAGLELPAQTPEATQKMERLGTLYQVLEEAARWFSIQLSTEAAAEARQYLSTRQVSEADIATFRIGFAPDNRQGLYQALKAKGVSDQLMDQAGLVHFKDGSPPLDRFRARIIFPIADGKGRVVAFGGRIMGDGQPKYLNSPETELFKKGQMLYGWHLARERAYKKGSIVAVEGYMDVIALHGVGITNAVAPLGTALTEGHLEQLWKVAAEPVLCMDGDAAGKRAMQRVAELCLPLLKAGQSLKFAFLPEGNDPDDLIHRQGVDSMRKVLMAARPLSEMLWNLEWEEDPPTTPEQKAAREKRLMQMAAAIKDPAVQQHYRQYFLQRLRQAGFNAFSKKKAKVRLTPIEQIHAQSIPAAERLEMAMLRLLMDHPFLLSLPQVEASLMELECQNEQLKALHSTLMEAVIGQIPLTTEELFAHLEKRGLASYIAYVRQQPVMGAANKDTSNDAVMRSEWEYLVAYHDLILAETQHAEVKSKFESDVSESLQVRLLELSRQLEQLKVVAENKKRVYEKLLEAQES